MPRGVVAVSKAVSLTKSQMEEEVECYKACVCEKKAQHICEVLQAISTSLQLSGCMITGKGCSSLASALKSIPSHLRELDLSYNHPGESGVKLLSDLLQDPHCALENLQVEHGGKIWMIPGLKKYACHIILDPNTAHTRLSLSEGDRKVENVRKPQPYPDHPGRFDWWEQVLSVESLTGRCYWDVEWSGSVIQRNQEERRQY
ncbi:E3 ubiquitin-protein ligase TRIM11-like [Hoplias malabaricus]|uniref:E3 ubiquitin-protein ligase TRIM11-like n=1 Tax=Hoplias malabaricus TaxID=27720 RepID=UPI0034623AE1